MTKIKTSSPENVQYRQPQEPKKPKGNIQELWDRQKAADPKLKMAKVSVAVKPSTMLSGDGIVLVVEVFSNKKPGNGKHGERQFSRFESLTKVREMACALGGALAELCIADWGDDYEPDECAKAAGEVFDAIKAQLEQGVLTKGILKE